jgi:hypothetical protein
MVVAFWDWVILDARFIFFLKNLQIPFLPLPSSSSQIDHACSKAAIMRSFKLPSFQICFLLHFTKTGSEDF